MRVQATGTEASAGARRGTPWKTKAHHAESRQPTHSARSAWLPPEQSPADVLGFMPHEALAHERTKCQKTLSRAVLGRELLLWKNTLDRQSRALTILHAASAEARRGWLGGSRVGLAPMGEGRRLTQGPQIPSDSFRSRQRGRALVR